ncbi:MAG: glutamate-1-semialdehyde 2,1-aminomutase [Lachnospiraceae bacterium]|nr:glutamate-1-semialdehyde 2,1-aminomutase [Lachnospiraceae bacterium]
MTRSEELFNRAVKRIPGGVNSPVRAYGAIGEVPRFIDHADGCYIYDADGNRYIDYIDSWGPMILGHNFPEIREAVLKACEKGLSFGCATEVEVEMAEFICEHLPHVEMVRMVNSGTEAVMSAVRAARGFTGKSKIIKFAGCYHGHSDALLVSAGSGVMTSGIPDSAGVPAGCTQDTMTAVYNDLDSVKTLMEQAKDQVAAVIVEPVAANMGVVLPDEGFLQGLRDLCDKNNALLIFDEVITGFRLAFGGAAEYFGVKPDMVTYGKIIGAGMPVGAYGGRKEIMEMVSPSGPVYQAGTLSGNPVAMAAGLTQLKYLYAHPEVYTGLEKKGTLLYEGMKDLAEKAGLICHLNHISSLGSIFFTGEKVCDYTSAKTSDTKAFANYFLSMLNGGIHLAPSQFEAMFLSDAHSEDAIHETLKVFSEVLEKGNLYE